MKSNLTLCILFFLCIGSVRVQSQNAFEMDKRLYLMQNYRLTDDQADRYQSKLIKFQSKLDHLRQQTLTSDQIKKRQKDAFIAFSGEVATVFSPEQYRQWKRTTQNIERFRYLSENMLVDRNATIALYNAEHEWSMERKALWNSSISEAEKHAVNQNLMEKLAATTVQILGPVLGKDYLNYKAEEQLAYINMDKYKTPYNEAFQIAKIEREYSAKRQEIRSVKRQHSETQALLDACDVDLLQAIKDRLTGTTGTKWERYHRDRLSSDMKTRYGLDQAAIAKFKSAYNRFAIEEYKIFHTNNLSLAEKCSALEKAAETFLTTVEPLFTAQKYAEWEGRWRYLFSRRLENKRNK